MKISPDQVSLFKIPIWGLDLDINMTIAGTWMAMAAIFLCARFLTRDFGDGFKMTKAQNAAEVVVKFISDQIEALTGREARRFLPLIGSLFIFILVANWSALIPIPMGGEWYMPPTASLSTAAALTIVVLASVIIYGIYERGARAYFGKFLTPIFVMLPLNILSEISSGLSLAVRLYGNIMSGGILAAIAFSLAPLFIPGLVNIYGLLAGTIQPYIFSTLAMVYIGAGMGEPAGGGNPAR